MHPHTRHRRRRRPGRPDRGARCLPTPAFRHGRREAPRAERGASQGIDVPPAHARDPASPRRAGRRAPSRRRSSDRLQYRTATDGIFAEFALSALRGETPFPYRLHLEQAQVTPIILDRLRGHAARPRAVRCRAASTSTQRAIARHRACAPQRRRATKRSTGAYLIGADGSRSDVRRALGIAFDGEDYPDKILRVMTGDDLDRAAARHRARHLSASTAASP